MNLKNYTSETPASRSIAHIEKRLVDIGALNVIKQYDYDKRLSGITFSIQYEGDTVMFRLPANIEAIFQVMWKEVRRPKATTEQRYRDQAERTAWKIIADWVDVQASIVMLK